MARIAGVNIPDNKRIEIALTYVYGIGLVTAKKILNTVSISLDKRVSELVESDLTKLSNEVKKYTVEGELKQIVFRNIKRLKDIRAYRGVRHKIGLPVRGQRTKTNAATRKGKNSAVGGLKLKITKT